MIIFHQLFWTAISLFCFFYLFNKIEKNTTFIIKERKSQLNQKNNLFLNYCDLNDKLRIEIDILNQERMKKIEEYLKNYELAEREKMQEKYDKDLQKFKINEIDYSDCYVSNEVIELVEERYI